MPRRIFIYVNITIQFIKFFEITSFCSKKKRSNNRIQMQTIHIFKTNRDYYLSAKCSTERGSLKKDQEIDLKLIHYSLHEKSKQKEKRGRIGTTSKRLPFFLPATSPPVQRSRCKPFSFNRIRSQASFHLPSRHFSFVNNG